MDEQLIEALKKSLEKEIKIRSWEDIRNDILNNLTKYILTGKSDNLKKILVPDIVEFEHPVVRTLLMGEGLWPNIIGSIRKKIFEEISRRGIDNVIVEIASEIRKSLEIRPKKKISRNVKNKIKNTLESILYSQGIESNLEAIFDSINDFFEGDIIEFIAKSFISSISKLASLRPFIFPGSIAEEKVYNLYYGEDFKADELIDMFIMFIKSVSIGNHIAIYLEGGAISEITEDIKERLLMTQFGSRHIIGRALSRLKIGKHENDKPYVVFTKFLIWMFDVYEQYLSGNEEAGRLQQILEDIKECHGLIYVVAKFKGDRTTVLLPKLEGFYMIWLENKKARRALRALLYEISEFLEAAYSSARKIKKESIIENLERVIANYLEIFLRTLIEYGEIHWESLRRIIDILIEISIHFDVSFDFRVIKYFEFATVGER